jgi:hypothetical protein
MAMANAELLDVLPTPPLPPTKTNWEFCVLLDGDLTINDAKVDVRLPVLLAVVLMRKVVVVVFLRWTCSAPGVEVRPRTAKDGATARRNGPTRTATLMPCATHNIACKRTLRRVTMTNYPCPFLLLVFLTSISFFSHFFFGKNRKKWATTVSFFFCL